MTEHLGGEEVTKNRTTIAIADIREARQSHVDWADWLEEHPEDDSSQVGDAPYPVSYTHLTLPTNREV